MNKRQSLLKLVAFFEKKGGVMTLEEYRACGTEVPMKDHQARRYWGSWNRITRAAEQFMGTGATSSIEGVKEKVAEAEKVKKVLEPVVASSEKDIAPTVEV